MSTAPSRRGYLDWLRGLAVLIMIEAHLLDSWTRVPDRQTREFAYALIVGGFGAPLFLFLAGVAVALSAGARLRRSGDAAAAAHAVAAHAVARRGAEIFGLSLVFRVQAWILGRSHPRTLLKVDILNIMGPSIVVAAWLWRAARSRRAQIAIFAAATTVIVALTPIVRVLPVLALLPDPLEAYIRPTAGLSNFVFFPWMAFVLAGAMVGVILDAARTAADERRANLAMLVIGLAAAWLAYRLSFLPSPFPGWYPQSYFWTTSPAFFVLRFALMTAAIGVAYLWERRPRGAEAWSPLRQLGRTSLFIYWIHVEMVYGLISLHLHKSLSWLQAWVALVLFWIFMLICSLAKDAVVSWWRKRGGSRSVTLPA
ncbi:MAG TPA: heparan-alpha-glucosaminide N-acetyltransferase domain-containing protein [Vicinamibacterales bacterium]|nr:heparan-alpha-glucosaminide N-acetyltransferase domain-containing protein [Vicinamibacterales bacterium]